MKVFAVRTKDDATVVLAFGDAGAHVLDRFLDRGGLYRVAGGLAFTAIAVAAVGLGISHSVHYGTGVALTVVAGVLVAAAGATAIAGWITATAADSDRRSGKQPPTIPADTVESARSDERGGTVTVTLDTADGTKHEFQASGMAGRQLAHAFAAMLGVDRTVDQDEPAH